MTLFYVIMKHDALRIDLAIIEFRWNNPMYAMYAESESQTLFLRSRVWGKRLENYIEEFSNFYITLILIIIIILIA